MIVTTKKKAQQFDKLAAVLHGVTPSRLREVLIKDTPITFRATRQERDDMHRVAKACGLTLTDYLIRLHAFASRQLFLDTKITQKKGR